MTKINNCQLIYKLLYMHYIISAPSTNSFFTNHVDIVLPVSQKHSFNPPVVVAFLCCNNIIIAAKGKHKTNYLHFVKQIVHTLFLQIGHNSCLFCCEYFALVFHFSFHHKYCHKASIDFHICATLWTIPMLKLNKNIFSRQYMFCFHNF